MSDNPESTDHGAEADTDVMAAQPPEMILVGTVDAGKVLKLSERTVRNRIAQGMIQGHKVGKAWLVELPRADVISAGIEIPESDDEGADLSGSGNLMAALGTRQPATTVDVAPMVDLIADLHRQVAELSAAAAMYQERARVLEEDKQKSLLAIESGKNAIENAKTETRDQVNAEWRSKSWWQRLKGE